MLGHLHSWYKSVERALWIDARQWLWTPQSGPLECTTSMSPNSSHGNRLQHDRKLSLHLMTIWEIISQVHFVFNWGDGMGQPMSVRHVDRNPCNIPPGKRLDDYTAGRRHKVDLKKKKNAVLQGGKKKDFYFSLRSTTCLYIEQGDCWRSVGPNWLGNCCWAGEACPRKAGGGKLLWVVSATCVPVITRLWKQCCLWHLDPSESSWSRPPGF